MNRDELLHQLISKNAELQDRITELEQKESVIIDKLHDLIAFIEEGVWIQQEWL